MHEWEFAIFKYSSERYDPAERNHWRNDRFYCRPGTSGKYLLPNDAVTGKTVTISQKHADAIRKAREREPYSTGIYSD